MRFYGYMNLNIHLRRGFALLHFPHTGFAVCAVALILTSCVNAPFPAAPPAPANFEQVQNIPAAMPAGRDLPALVVTDEAPPAVIYRRGFHDTVLAHSDATSPSGFSPLNTENIETAVTQKAKDLAHDLEQLQEDAEGSVNRFRSLQEKSDAETSTYYAMVAAINTSLQGGTTPGNPILVDRWNTAQDKLNSFSGGTNLLNTLATDLTNQASRAAFLMESIRAAFAISGAVDEDHKKLTVLEESSNQNIGVIHRLMTKVSDELARRTSYMRTERANLQSLSLSVANGELYGQSMTNNLFKNATSGSTRATAVPPSRRPLVIIRFDRANVDYDQPLYKAVSRALEKYPAAKFDLVAVSPSEGDPATLALAASEARKNGTAVVRSLTQMGLPVERLNLSAANSKTVLNSEIHIFLR